MTVSPHPAHTPDSDDPLTPVVDALLSARFKEIVADKERRKAHHHTMQAVRELRAAGYSYTWLARFMDYNSRQRLRQAYERWEEAERRKRTTTTDASNGDQSTR